MPDQDTRLLNPRDDDDGALNEIVRFGMTPEGSVFATRPTPSQQRYTGRLQQWGGRSLADEVMIEQQRRHFEKHPEQRPRTPEELQQIEEEKQREAEERYKLLQENEAGLREETMQRLEQWRADQDMNPVLRGVRDAWRMFRAIDTGAADAFGRSVELGVAATATGIAGMFAGATETALKLATYPVGFLAPEQTRAFNRDVSQAVNSINELAYKFKTEHQDDLRFHGGETAAYIGGFGVMAGEMAVRLSLIKAATGHLYGLSNAKMTAETAGAVKALDSFKSLPGIGQRLGEAVGSHARFLTATDKGIAWANKVLAGGTKQLAWQRLKGAAGMGTVSALMQRYEGDEFSPWAFAKNWTWGTMFMGTTIASGLIPGEKGLGMVMRVAADYGLNTTLSAFRNEFNEAFQGGYAEALDRGLSHEEAMMLGRQQEMMVHFVNFIFASKTGSYEMERSQAESYLARVGPQVTQSKAVAESARKTYAMGAENARRGILYEIERKAESSRRAGRPDSDATLSRLAQERSRWQGASDDDIIGKGLVYLKDQLGVDIRETSGEYLKGLERQILDITMSNQVIRDDQQRAESALRIADRELPPGTQPDGKALLAAHRVAGTQGVGQHIGQALQAPLRAITGRLSAELTNRAEGAEGESRARLKRAATAANRITSLPTLVKRVNELYPDEADRQRVFGAEGRQILDMVRRGIEAFKADADSRTGMDSAEVAGLVDYARWVKASQDEIRKVMEDSERVEAESKSREADVVEAHRAAADERKAVHDAVQGEFRFQEGRVTPELDRENAAVVPPDVAAKLEAEEKVTVFRAMQLIDGKLYPPMSAKVDGKLRPPTEIGRWEQAVENPELAKDGKFVLDKANKSSRMPVAYNPYFHTSRSPLNDQFASASKRPNLVTVEVEIPASELTSGYRAQGAKDAVGEVPWRSGPVSSKLPPSKERKVILSRYAKVTRIVPDSEVADNIATLLKGENVAIPDNVVTPSLRQELMKRSIPTSPDIRFQPGDVRGHQTREAVQSEVAERITKAGGEFRAQKTEGPVIGQINIGRTSISVRHEEPPREGAAGAIRREGRTAYTMYVSPTTGRVSTVAHELGHVVRDVLEPAERAILSRAGIDVDSREGDEAFARQLETTEGRKALAEQLRALTPEHQGVVTRALNRIVDFINAVFGTDMKHFGDIREFERLAEGLEDFGLLSRFRAGAEDVGMREAPVHHGTPHVWTPEPGFPHGRPRLDKIGTGEGAQAFGHGIYFAEAEGVGRSYAKESVSFDGKPIVLGWDDVHGKDRSIEQRAKAWAASWGVEEGIREARSKGTASDLEVAKWIEANRDRFAEESTLYKLDIPDDVMPKLLDWDGPVSSEMKDAIKSELLKDDFWLYSNRGLKSMGIDFGQYIDVSLFAGINKGREMYRMLSSQFGHNQAASEFLARAGIPGNKYLDQQIRDAGEGTRNFVIWDQPTLDRIALLERNGERLDAIREGQEEQARFQMAGERAATANVGELGRAREMLAAGRSMDDIRRETGWERPVEGEKWMFDVDENKITFRKGQNLEDGFVRDPRGLTGSPVPLGSLIDAPDLFRAYPFLKDVGVHMVWGGDIAQWDGSRIWVGEQLKGSEVRKALAHEIQHAIQEREGFRRGTSPDAELDRVSVPADLNRERAAMLPTLRRAGATLSVRVAEGGSGVARISDLKTGKEMSVEEMDAFRRKHPKEFMQFLGYKTKERTALYDAAYSSYSLHTGEALARVAQRRLDMTPEQRTETSIRQSLIDMLKEEGLLKEGQTPEDVLIHRGGEGPQEMARFQPAAAPDDGKPAEPRPVDSFGARLTPRMLDILERLMGRAHGGDISQDPKDVSERAWELVNDRAFEAERMTRAEREAFAELAPTKDVADERFREFMRHAEAERIALEEQGATARAIPFARQAGERISRDTRQVLQALDSVEADSTLLADTDIAKLLSGIERDSPEDRALMDYLWGSQKHNVPEADINLLPPSIAEKVGPIRARLAEVAEMVNLANERAGLEPITILPDFFPLLRNGQFGRLAQSHTRGQTIAEFLSLGLSPESIHDRSDGVKDKGVYRRSAVAQLHHYIKSMSAYAMLRVDMGEGSTRANDIYSAIHGLAAKSNTTDVIIARDAWDKAQQEGATEPRNDIERAGKDIEDRIAELRGALAERDMIDDMSQVPDVAANRTLADARRLNMSGTAREPGRLEANIVNPWNLHNSIDGKSTFDTSELGPNARLWMKGALEGPARYISRTDEIIKEFQEIIKISGEAGSDQGHLWLVKDAKLTRINHFQERNVEDFKGMSDAEAAALINSSPRPDLPIMRQLPMIAAGEVTADDVRMFRALLGKAGELHEQARPHFAKMYSIRHKAFQDINYRDMGDRQSFLAKLESLSRRIALSEVQADNITEALHLSRFYRTNWKGTEQGRKILGDMWENIALVNWARGPHPHDKRFFSRTHHEAAQAARDDGKPPDWFDRIKGVASRGGLLERGVRTTNNFLPTLFLAGNLRWALTKQWTSLASVPGYTGYGALAQGFYTYFRDGIERIMEERGVMPVSERHAEGLDYRGSTFHEIKRSRTSMQSLEETNKSSLRTSASRTAHSCAQAFAGFLEGTLAGATWEAARISGKGRAMDDKERQQYFQAMVTASTQSLYNRDSRALLLNSQLFRFIAPFQSFAFDAFTSMVWEPTRSGGMSGSERFWYVARGAIAVGLVNYISSVLFGRKAFEGWDKDAPSWQVWSAYGSFMPGLGSARGPQTGSAWKPPVIDAVGTPLVRALQDYYRTGDATQLAKRTGPFFIAGMGLPWAQMFPQAIDTVQAMQYDGMAVNRYGIPFRALDDTNALTYWTDVVLSLSLGPERTPLTIPRQEQARELGVGATPAARHQQNVRRAQGGE